MLSVDNRGEVAAATLASVTFGGAGGFLVITDLVGGTVAGSRVVLAVDCTVVVLMMEAVREAVVI